MNKRGFDSSGISTALASAMLAVVFVWAYWPTLADLESTWRRESDYSHGYLVIPVALCCLWARRESLATLRRQPSLWGLIPFGLAVALNHLGTLYYLRPLEHLSMILWIAGAFWLLGGWQVFLWSLPALAFLLFMFPVPFRYERLFAMPLQRLATVASCWLLQTVGLPAFASGNVINVGDFQIEVVRACSGLRMLVGFGAVCVAYAIITRRPLWQKLVIAASAVPIALVSNVARIAAAGILSQHVDPEIARSLVHDAGGVAMVPVGLLLLLATLWYLDHLFIEDDAASSPVLARRARLQNR